MFSVIIPYYKKKQYIERCLDSVVSQTFQDFEIILIDDGSEDDIYDVIAEKYDGKVKLIQQKNQGVSIARNTGINNANRSYMAFLDADDCWSPLYLEYANEVIKRENHIKIIGTFYTRNKQTLEISRQALAYRKIIDYFKRQAIVNTLFSASSSIISRAFFIENPGFNPQLKRGEDIDVWVRVVASGGNVFYVNNILVYYSDEDADQATKKIRGVNNSLVENINKLYKPLFEKYQDLYFERFVSNYVYFNLYPYYFDKDCRAEAKESLRANRHFSFFLHLPYYLPFWLGNKMVSLPFLNKMLRYYLKFFLRYIYL